MVNGAGSEGFYGSLPRVSSFAALSDPASYTPLPNDWSIGVADIVGSTEAVAAGQYKSVNMVGAAVISAQINRRDGHDFPYVFGGDGAAFAVSADEAEEARAALAAVRAWAAEEFRLNLRVSMVPVADIRAAGRDVGVARYAASADVDYAMFSGGGLSWAETQMKKGNYALPPAPDGARPDLTGLSCRWSHIRARRGSIASVVIEPRSGVPEAGFAALAERVIAIVQKLDRGGHPIPETGAEVHWPPAGMRLEAHASRGDGALFWRQVKLLFGTLMAWLIFRLHIRIGEFQPDEYRRETGRNADFRKFDDGLKMTLDCDPDTLRELREVLEEARASGVIEYGIFEQDEAMMTCIVPTVMRADHMHFIDGASGGYTEAAARMSRPREPVRAQPQGIASGGAISET